MNVLIVVATKFEITSDKIAQKPTLITGIGMVNTAINLTKELMKNRYDLVINMGVAGSFSNELRNGDVIEVIEDNFSEIGFENDLEISRFTDFDLQIKYQFQNKLHHHLLQMLIVQGEKSHILQNK